MLLSDVNKNRACKQILINLSIAKYEENVFIGSLGLT